MKNNFEYIKLFVEYESVDLPVVYLYEVDLNNNRFLLREIEIFANKIIKFDDDPYRDVIEVIPIPTTEEFNAKIWGEGFYATVISVEEFNEIWNNGIYTGSLAAT